MKTNINVGIIGFSLHEREKFECIFGSGLERDRTYRLKNLTTNETVDILIVKTATESALQKQESYQQQHGSLPVVTAGKAPLDGFKYHIQGVLIVSRVLKALDLVELTDKTEPKSSFEEQPSEIDSVNVGSQYDILVVNADTESRQLLKEELMKADIPLNIDFTINQVSAIQKIKDKYYDFLFVDDDIADFSAIEKSIRNCHGENVRSSIVMPTSKAETVKCSQIMLKFLKSFADSDTMIAGDDDESQEAVKNYNVLIVDDSQMMHKVLKMELDKADIQLEVDYAFSGEEALEKIEHKNYDFVFLDVMMPGIDGFETCGRIRKIKVMAKTPVIMLTSKTSPLDEVKGIMAGCTTYLTKPIASDEFQKMLARIMRWL